MIPVRREIPSDGGLFYRTHVQKVARWAERLAGPNLDTEDIVHEVFMIAYQRMATFRGDSSLPTWLFAITDKVVRHRRRKERWRRWLGGSADETAGHLPAPGRDPLGVLESRRSVSQVYAILNVLPERDRQILILCELEELGAEEVGRLLGIAPANARLRLHRARSRFARAYHELRPEEAPGRTVHVLR